MVIDGAARVASSAAARDANALRVSNYTLGPNAAAANAHDQHRQPPPNPPFVTITDPAIPLDFPQAVFKHTLDYVANARCSKDLNRQGRKAESKGDSIRHARKSRRGSYPTAAAAQASHAQNSAFGLNASASNSQPNTSRPVANKLLADIKFEKVDSGCANVDC